MQDISLFPAAHAWIYVKEKCTKNEHTEVTFLIFFLSTAVPLHTLLSYNLCLLWMNTYCLLIGSVSLLDSTLRRLAVCEVSHMTHSSYASFMKTQKWPQISLKTELFSASFQQCFPVLCCSSQVFFTLKFQKFTSSF